MSFCSDKVFDFVTALTVRKYAWEKKWNTTICFVIVKIHSNSMRSEWGEIKSESWEHKNENSSCIWTQTIGTWSKVGRIELPCKYKMYGKKDYKYMDNILKKGYKWKLIFIIIHLLPFIIIYGLRWALISRAFIPILLFVSKMCSQVQLGAYSNEYSIWI